MEYNCFQRVARVDVLQLQKCGRPFEMLFIIGSVICIIIVLICISSLRPTIFILEYVEDGQNLAVVRHQGFAYHVSWLDQPLDYSECGTHYLLVPGVECICYKGINKNGTLKLHTQVYPLLAVSTISGSDSECYELEMVFHNIEISLFFQHNLSHPHNLMWCRKCCLIELYQFPKQEKSDYSERLVNNITHIL